MGINIDADELFDEDMLNSNNFDALVIPGGGNGSTIMGGNPVVIDFIKKFIADQSKIVGAICASPAKFLQAHGMLEGYDKVTCYPTLSDQLKDKYVANQTVVRCKNLITSPSPGTAIEFAVALVKAI